MTKLNNQYNIPYLKDKKIINRSIFYNASGVYELYYSLLNVYLWSREYLKNIANIISFNMSKFNTRQTF